MTSRPTFLASCAILIAIALCPIAIPQVAATADTGITLSNMDPSVRPGNNFFLYANGGYIARTKLPPDRAGLNVFTVLSDTNDQKVASHHPGRDQGAGPRRLQ